MRRNKTLPKKHSASHRKMLTRHFGGNEYHWTNYENQAEIIWEGKHYVLIRTGVHAGVRCRYVYMADKLGLLITGNSTPLEQLAAGLHPVQTERAADELVTLHDSSTKGENIGEIKGRWGKTRFAECVRYAEAAEAVYEQKMPEWIADWERRQEEAAALKLEERSVAAQLIKFTRRESRKVGGHVGSLNNWHSGRYATRVARLDSGRLKFNLEEEDWMVIADADLRVTTKQFKRLVRLVCEFEKENKAVGNLPTEEGTE